MPSICMVNSHGVEPSGLRMRGRLVRADSVDPARTLHRLAFALWRAVFYLQRGQIRGRTRSRSLATEERKRPVCLQYVFGHMGFTHNLQCSSIAI